MHFIEVEKVKISRVELLMELHLSAMECHLPYGITQPEEGKEKKWRGYPLYNKGCWSEFIYRWDPPSVSQPTASKHWKINGRKFFLVRRCLQPTVSIHWRSERVSVFQKRLLYLSPKILLEILIRWSKLGERCLWYLCFCMSCCSSNIPRTVTLQRRSEGYGFILRGARSTCVAVLWSACLPVSGNTRY